MFLLQSQVRPGQKMQVIMEANAQAATQEWQAMMMRQRQMNDSVGSDLAVKEFARSLIIDRSRVDAAFQKWAASKVPSAEDRKKSEKERLKVARELDAQIAREVEEERKKLKAFEQKRFQQEKLDMEQDRERERIEKLIGAGESIQPANTKEALRELVEKVRGIALNF